MEYGGRNWGSLAPFSAAEFIGRKSLIEVQLIVQCKRSLEIAPIYLLICVNKELSTAIAQPIAPICGFGKELFEVYRKFNGAPDAPGAAAAAGNLPPERNRLKKTRALEKFLPSAGDYGNRRNFQTPLTLDYGNAPEYIHATFLKLL